MKLFYLLFLATLGIALSEKVSYRNYKVYQIIPKDDAALKALRELEDQSTEFSTFQFWHGATKVGHEVTLMVAPQTQETIEQMLSDLKVDSRIMIQDVQQKIDAENRLARNDGLSPFDWTVYNTLDEVYIGFLLRFIC